MPKARVRTKLQRKSLAKTQALAKQMFGVLAQRVTESPEVRAHMAQVLDNSPDPRVQKLVSDLHTPTHDILSIARLAERHGLNYHDLSDEYTRLRKSEGFIRAAHHIPEIMEQVAEDAKNKWIECDTCHGAGQIDSKKGIVPCTARGCVDGKVYVPASIDHLKLMFNTFGLTKADGGGVNVNMDMRKMVQHESLGDLAGTLEGIVSRPQEKP